MRTRLDEIIDGEIGDWKIIAREKLERIAERAFRHGVEQTYLAYEGLMVPRGLGRRRGVLAVCGKPIEPAPADEHPAKDAVHEAQAKHYGYGKCMGPPEGPLTPEEAAWMRRTADYLAEKYARDRRRGERRKFNAATCALFGRSHEHPHVVGWCYHCCEDRRTGKDRRSNPALS